MNIKIFIQHSPCKLSGSDLVIDCYPPYGFVTTPGTTIISPNYPNYYPSNDISYCQVTLIFEDRISIEFESFDVGSDGSCSLDWFRVFDGNSSDSPLIGSKLCGKYRPRPMESSGNSMTLEFRPYHGGSFKGFKVVAYQGNN